MLANLSTLAAPPTPFSRPSDFELFLNFLNSNALWIMIGTITVSAIVFGTIKEVLKSRNRELSRREIAAYIAEGSMTPEQGERLLRAGRSAGSC